MLTRAKKEDRREHKYLYKEADLYYNKDGKNRANNSFRHGGKEKCLEIN